jgi:hypothetical protein
MMMPLVQVWKYNSFEYSDDPVASAIYLQASFHSHDAWHARCLQGEIPMLVVDTS